MKKILLLLLLSPLLLAMTCDDDPSNDTPGGTWELVNVSGGIAGISHDFPDGAIIWKFNTGNDVKVTVNIQPENSIPYFFDTGTYTRDYVDNEISETCEHTVVIDDINFGCQWMENDVLIFTQLVTDGYTLTFARR